MILKRPIKNDQQDIIDKYNVKELIEFERFCRDNALWDEMNKCFAKDSKVIISWFQGTSHEFVDASKKMKDRAPHKIYNTEIWLNGDKAVAIMMATIQKRMNVDNCLVELNSDAKIIYCVERVNGEWFIVLMKAIYEKDCLVPVLPSKNINIPTEEISKYRESYGCLTYSLMKSGYEIDNNLPGIDRPDLVEKLYAEVNQWLKN